MLTDFFKLNDNSVQTFTTQTELIAHLGRSNDLRNVFYQPSDLKQTSGHPKQKIKNTSFNNVSFSKTKFENVVFYNCEFEDCLFIGVEIVNCGFHNCSFKNCNTFKIRISNTYIHPNSFSNCFSKIEQANIAVHLFQQLVNNSTDEEQSRFRRYAEYNFKKWQDKLTLNKYKNHQPYKISIFVLLRQYPINWLYRYSFGYGLRLRNFIISFITIFTVFFSINYINWKNYALCSKDFPINAYDENNVNFASNFYYTIDATTKLVDSQFQASTNFGMYLLTLQGVVGFIFLSALITIILNRFVK